MTTQPPFDTPPPPMPSAPKKGMSGWAWAGIGCGGVLLIVIACVAGLSYFGVKKYKEFAADKEQVIAEIIIASHPDLEKVSSNKTKGEITVRSKSGDEYTVNYKEITEGRFSFKDSEGNITQLSGSPDFSDLPSWVPQIPAISGEPGLFHSVKNGKASGVYHAATSGTLEDTDAFYKEALEKSGFSSSSSTSTNWGGSQTLNRTYLDASREVTVTISEESGKPVSVRLSYQEK